MARHDVKGELQDLHTLHLPELLRKVERIHEHAKQNAALPDATNGDRFAELAAETMVANVRELQASAERGLRRLQAPREREPMALATPTPATRSARPAGRDPAAPVEPMAEHTRRAR